MHITQPSVLTNGKMSSLLLKFKTKLYIKDNFEQKNQDAVLKKTPQCWPIYKNISMSLNKWHYL